MILTADNLAERLVGCKNKKNTELTPIKDVTHIKFILLYFTEKKKSSLAIIVNMAMMADVN